jgi:hypothetical protein
MKSTPLEYKRWFNITVTILGASIALVCMLMIRSYIPKTDQHTQFALALLFIGAVSGFVGLLRLFLPLILVKVFPKLDE